MVSRGTSKRFNEVPDLFTPGGMSAAISIVEALKNQKVMQMRKTNRYYGRDVL